jgi:glycosyltransferase involved in cell wall biosynthesis
VVCPTISVIIPCFNDGQCLAEAVESVKSQVGNFLLEDIFIVDDHSDDIQTQVVLSKLRADPRIKVLSNMFSKGPSGARNTGLKVATASWVIFLDADDFLLPDSIEDRVKALEPYPEINWCGGDFKQRFPDGSYGNGPVYRNGEKKTPAFNNYGFDNSLLIRKPVEHFSKRMLTRLGAVIIKTQALKEVGGFNEGLLFSEDSNLFIRLAARNDFLFIPKVLYVRRERYESYSRQERSPREWSVKNFKSLLKEPDFAPYQKLIKKRISYFYLDDHRFYMRHRHYVKSLKAYFCYKNYNRQAKLESWKMKWKMREKKR